MKKKTLSLAVIGLLLMHASISWGTDRGDPQFRTDLFDYSMATHFIHGRDDIG